MLGMKINQAFLLTFLQYVFFSSSFGLDNESSQCRNGPEVFPGASQRCFVIDALKSFPNKDNEMFGKEWLFQSNSSIYCPQHCNCCGHGW